MTEGQSVSDDQQREDLEQSDYDNYSDYDLEQDDSPAPQGNPDDPHDHRPKPYPTAEAGWDATGFGAVPAAALTEEERKFAEQAEIKGWREMKVYDEVPIETARRTCRSGNGAIITTRMVYARKEPTSEYPQGQPKARCVARGFQDQREDVDSNSPAASGDSRRCFIAIALARRLHVVIADVWQAYLNADLTSQSTVFLVPPTRFSKPGMVWRLNRAVYGLADAGTLWYECISARLLARGWDRLPEDPCIYVKGNKLAVLYVDDLLIAAETEKAAMDEIIALNFKLGKGRAIKSGDSFTGVTIKFDGGEFHKVKAVTLTQESYSVEKIPDPVWKRKTTTPLPVTLTQREPEKEVKLDVAEHRSYRALVGKIMWLATTTRPDLAYAAAYLSRANASPSDRDFQLADRCGAYIKATAKISLVIPAIDLSNAEILVIHDASFAAPRDDHRSQTGYIVLLTNRHYCAVLAWKSATQKRRVSSSMASECYAAQPAWRHALHLQRLLSGMLRLTTKLSVRSATDNDDLYKIIKIRKRSVPKDRSLTICVHTLREMVDHDDMGLHFVEGKVNPADSLTKPMTNMQSLLTLMRGTAVNIGEDHEPLAAKREKM